MSELLTATTNDNSHESEFLSHSETAERESNVEAKQQLALDVLKLVESNDSKAIGDYFSEALDNKIEVSDSERDAIFDFLSGQQRIKLSNSILRKQDEVIENLDYQSKQSRYSISDAADNFIRKIDITGQDMEKNINSKLRNSADYRLALRGVEPVLTDVKSSVRDLDILSDRLLSSCRWKNETIQKYKLEFNNSDEKQHLEALDIASAKDQQNRELSPLIDQDVIQSSVEKIRKATSEAKESGKSPKEAIFDIFNEKTKEPTADTLHSISVFINKTENIADPHNGDLSTILQKSEEVKSLLKSFIKTGSDLLEDRRIHPEIAIDISRKLHVGLDTASQLSFNLRRDLDRLSADESHLFHKEEISKPSLFR